MTGREGIKTFVSLEGLRGYMAWWVVIGHAIQLCGAKAMLPKPLASLLLHGSAAVNVFVIVSGFVITHLIVSKNENYRVYLMRRVLRIFPIYLFCLLAALLSTTAYEFTFTLGDWVDQREMRIDRLTETGLRFWEHLTLHLTMLHGILPDTLLPFSSSTILAPAWSLSLEWQFYLIAPFLICTMQSSRYGMIATVFASMVLLLLFQAGFFGIWHYPSALPLSIHFFLIGILCRLLFQDIAWRSQWLIMGGGAPWP